MTASSITEPTAGGRAGIVAAIACITIAGVSLSLSVPLLTFAMAARGASGAEIGLNTAMAGLAVVAVSPMIPRAVAAFGVKAILFGALVLGAVTIVAFHQFDALWAWYPLRFLFGVSFAALFVISEFWINAAAPPKSRGLVMGVYVTALSIGFAAGPLLLVATGMDGPAPYLACAVLFALAAIPVALSGGATPQIERPSAGRGVAFFVRIAPAATFAGFVFGAIETGGFTFLPLYGARVGLDVTAAALLATAVNLGNVVSQIPIGILSDRMDRRRLLMIIGLASLAGALAIPVVASWSGIALYGLLMAWGGVACGLYTVGLAHLGARFTGVDLATANAAFIIMYSIGMLVGPPLLGAGFDLWNPHGAPAGIALLLAGYVVVLLFTRRETAPRSPSP